KPPVAIELVGAAGRRDGGAVIPPWRQLVELLGEGQDAPEIVPILAAKRANFLAVAGHGPDDRDPRKRQRAAGGFLPVITVEHDLDGRLVLLDRPGFAESSAGRGAGPRAEEFPAVTGADERSFHFVADHQLLATEPQRQGVAIVVAWRLLDVLLAEGQP